MDCDDRVASSRIDMTDMPPRCLCGGIYRPDCIFFGEMIPPQTLVRSQQVASKCPIMLVVGTSAVVHPAAAMPAIAKQNGARIIEINPESTPLTANISDDLIQGKATEVMQALMTELERLA